MTLDEIRALDAAAPMPNPTENDLKDPLFDAIWQVIKSWDVNVPAYYVGYCGANGSHAKLILDAARSMLLPLAERNAKLEAPDPGPGFIGETIYGDSWPSVFPVPSPGEWLLKVQPNGQWKAVRVDFDAVSIPASVLRW